MSEKIANQFKKFRDMEPSREWSVYTRENLVNVVRQDTMAGRSNWLFKFRLVFLNSQKLFMSHAYGLAAFLLTVVLIGGTSIAAEAEYLPSKVLYKVKQTLEKVELVLATSPRQEAKIYLKHAKKRADEALKLAANNQGDAKYQEKNLNTIVSKLKHDLNSASATLDLVNKNNEAGDEDVANLAKEVTTNAQDAGQALAQAAGESESQEIAETLTRAVSETDKVEIQALEVLISGKEETFLNGSVLTNAEKTDLLNAKISRLTLKLDKAGVTLETMSVLIANVQPESQAEVSLILSEADHKALAEKQLKTKEILKAAETLLQAKDYLKSLEKIKEASIQVGEIEERLSKIDVEALNQATKSEANLEGEGTEVKIEQNKN